MKRGPAEPVIEFSTLVEALRWRALTDQKVRQSYSFETLERTALFGIAMSTLAKTKQMNSGRILYLLVTY